ncbi:SDR family oxidoreductase [Bifidobacterium subtile]|uniref:SDR family oxidoreductase n=1 Tax=Bifidobacterium subtile TaxID=77635 RepID=UPI002F352E88
MALRLGERREALIAVTHTKRAVTPEDVAGLAFFLAGPDARQITGQTIHLNGGAYTTCFGSIVFCGFGQVVFSGLGVGHADHSRAVPW